MVEGDILQGRTPFYRMIEDMNNADIAQALRLCFAHFEHKGIAWTEGMSLDSTLDAAASRIHTAPTEVPGRLVMVYDIIEKYWISRHSGRPMSYSRPSSRMHRQEILRGNTQHRRLRYYANTDSFSTLDLARCLEAEESNATEGHSTATPEDPSQCPTLGASEECTLPSYCASHHFQLNYHQKTVFAGPLLPLVPADYLLHVNDKDLRIYLDDLHPVRHP